jgi:hypothetical protein
MSQNAMGGGTTLCGERNAIAANAATAAMVLFILWNKGHASARPGDSRNDVRNSDEFRKQVMRYSPLSNFFRGQYKQR